MVKVLNKCILSAFVYNLVYRQTAAQYLFYMCFNTVKMTENTIQNM